MDEIIDKLKSPNCLKTVCSDLDRLAADVKKLNKSSASVKLLVQIHGHLKDASWLNAVDSNILYASVSKLCQNVQNASDAEYQNYLTCFLNIFRFTLKKGVHLNDVSHLDLVFRNFALPMKHEHSKLYWVLFVDAINSLVITNKNEPTAHILSNLIAYLEELLRISNIISFCKNNLSWVVRKLYVSFNDFICEDLDTGFDRIFELLFTLYTTNEEETSADEDVFKNFLVSFNVSTQIPSTSGKSVSSILKLSKKLFEKDKMYLNFIDVLSIAAPLFSLPLQKFSPSFNKIPNSLCTAIEKVGKNSPTDLFNEFILTLRKILNCKLSQWIKESNDMWKKHFSLDFQLSLLKLLKTTVEKLNKCKKQCVKCSECSYESGAHDALQLASLGRYFVKNSAQSKIETSKLVTEVAEILNLQIHIILKLRDMKCPGWKNFWNNVETNYHSDAILLYSSGANLASLDLFNAYWSGCIRMLSVDVNVVDHGNFSRALFNMAICHLDALQFENALYNCYLSMAMNSIRKKDITLNTPHAQFIIRIKSKMLESRNSSEKYCKYNNQNKIRSIHCECFESVDSFQRANVWSVCTKIILNDASNIYAKLLANADFGALLLFEMEAHNSFWFSTTPISGIFKSMQELSNNIDVNEKNRNDVEEYESLITFGKIITLVNSQPTKLHNRDIISFIRFAVEKYESYLSKSINDLLTIDKIFIYLLYANILKAYYEVKFHEKVNSDKFSPLPTTTSDLTRGDHYSVHPDDACDIAPTHLSLTLSTEQDILQPLFKAIKTWHELLCIADGEFSMVFESDRNKLYLEKSFDTVESVVRILSLRGLDAQSLKAADIACSLGKLANNRNGIIRATGFMIQSCSFATTSVSNLINESNTLVKELLTESSTSSSLHTAYEYLLNLSIYYHNCDLKEKGVLLLNYVQNRILDHLTKTNDADFKNDEHIKFVYAKLIDAQSLYISSNIENGESLFNNNLSYLSSVTNACVEYSELAKSVGHSNWQSLAVLHLWVESCLQAGRVALLLGLPRRARAILKGILSTVQRLLLPRRTVQILLLLADTDLVAERFDDCKVKFDTIHYIMEERSETTVQSAKILRSSEDFELNKYSDIFTLKGDFSDDCKSVKSDSPKQFEMVLDVPTDRYTHDSLGGSPVFESSPFKMPSFIDHERKCDCGKCTSITMFNLTLDTLHLQMNLYCKTGELKVAQSFVSGGFKLLQFLNSRLNYVYANILKTFKNVTYESIEASSYFKMFTFSKCRFLTDVGYFLMKENNLVKAEMLNAQIRDLLTLLPSNQFLLMQSVYEQKLSLMEMHIFCESHETFETLESLSSDFESKLLMSPRRGGLNGNLFKTPMVKNMKPPSPIKRIKLPRGKTLFNDNDDDDMPQFNKPIIKLNLDAENDDRKPSNEVQIENVERTPAPRLNLRRNASLLKTNCTNSKTASNGLQTKSASDVIKSSLSAKSRLKRATSPGNLSVQSNKPPQTKITASKTAKAKVENKSSPDKNVTKKYATRRRL
ncbi:uncharacterized protein LOC143917872 [Arctopsyche grandis]|uniref:uncharacterized protein LOC143917872 n=1 Tax=Arctopsyche grandis TaxID=121162 RepID=UPI00406D9F5B